MRSKGFVRALNPSRAILSGVVAVGLAIGMGFTPAFAGNEGAADRKQCEFQFVPVSLAPGGPATSRIATWLCYEGSPVGKTVQLLIHGAMFNHSMWDFPLDPEHYSYVDHAIRRGYATLNIDRLGIGINDHPPGMDVDLDSNTWAIHQVVQALRAGELGSAGEPFAKVVAVGNSFGSALSLFESAVYDDVDAIVLTGFVHELNLAGVAKWIGTFYPAYLDPKFASQGYPSDYLTTLPGMHPLIFINPEMADPAVMAMDDALKGTATEGEFGPNGAFVALQPQFSLAVHVPVLIADGQDDEGSCGPGLPCKSAADILARESAFWSPEACLEAFVLPRSGHDMNAQYNAVSWSAHANDWIDRRAGRDADHPATQPCP